MKKWMSPWPLIGVLLLCSSWSPLGRGPLGRGPLGRSPLSQHVHQRPIEKATHISRSTRGHLDDPRTLSRLSTSLPDTTCKRSLSHCISHMLGQQAGAKEKELVVIQQRKATDINDGLAGDPIFFVKSGQGPLRYVVKAYQDPQKLACELSAFDLLASMSLKKAHVPALTAIGRAATEKKHFSLLAYEYLSGDPVTSLFQRVGATQDRWERKAQFKAAKEAVFAIGLALAELHNTKVEVSQELAPYFVQKEERTLTKFLAAVERHPYLLTMPTEEFESVFRSLQKNRSAVARCHTYAHLDPHLGNWLYDEEKKQLSMIDLQTLHFSVGEEGRPLASPWLDYVVVYFNLEGMGNLYGLTHLEIADLQEAFHNSYRSESILPLPQAEELAFYSLFYWMKMVAIFDRPSASDSPSISCQKEQMAEWGGRRLGECLKNFVGNDPYREQEKYREGEAPSGQWIVGL